jgi:hypothetical protein
MAVQIHVPLKKVGIVKVETSLMQIFAPKYVETGSTWELMNVMMETRTVETAAHQLALLNLDGSASGAAQIIKILAGKHAVMESEMKESNAMMGIW